jgi:hypothetical protein
MFTSINGNCTDRGIMNMLAQAAGQEDFWTRNGGAVIAAAAALIGTFAGTLVAPILADRRKRKQDQLTAVRTALAAFLSAGEDLIAAANTIVGMQRAEFEARRDRGVAKTALLASADYRAALRELEIVYWKAFGRQRQILLVLPDVKDTLVDAVRAKGDDAWGKANATEPGRTDWDAALKDYRDAATRLIQWARTYEI